MIDKVDEVDEVEEEDELGDKFVMFMRLPGEKRDREAEGVICSIWIGVLCFNG